MSEHTKGLLALFRNGQSVGSTDGTGVCELWPRDENGFPDCEGKENGRRIIACWNLLDGYDTEALEGVTLAEFVAKQAYLNEMNTNDGINLSLSGLAVQMLVASFAGQFKANGATNYLELRGSHPETGPFTITMQRAEGLTPADKLNAITKQRDVLLEALNGVLGVMNNSQGVAGWHKNGDIATWDEVLPEVAAALEFVEGEQS
ncbi:hypothetical protein [Aeromonas salmonicida]|uniref:hypothetical protein n=1 Tax=Aeromonas salmonicida TaxID=645 RepID=UPI001F1F842E|nr:hypothetical protein [Aeromonas salmonicida]MCE9933602.1 hypothetical protein [Aeromonas salmonicida]